MDLIRSDVRFFVRSEILKAETMNGTVFGTATPFTVLEIYCRFGRA
jgi:hypothetical protein